MIHMIHMIHIKGGSRSAATSKMERFVIIVNGWKPLTIITKHSILNVAAAVHPPLHMLYLHLMILSNANFELRLIDS